MASYRRRQAQRLAPQIDAQRPTERAQALPGLGQMMTRGQAAGRGLPPGGVPITDQPPPLGPPRQPPPGGPPITDWPPPAQYPGRQPPPGGVPITDWPPPNPVRQPPPGPFQPTDWYPPPRQLPPGGVPVTDYPQQPPRQLPPWGPPVTDTPQGPTYPPFDRNPVGGGQYTGQGGGLGLSPEQLAEEFRKAQALGPNAVAQFMAAHPRFADQYGYGNQALGPPAPIQQTQYPGQGGVRPDVPYQGSRPPGWETPPGGYPGGPVSAPAQQTPGYWTPENMGNAQPMPLPQGPGYNPAQPEGSNFYNQPPRDDSAYLPQPPQGFPFSQAQPAGGQDFRQAPAQGATDAATRAAPALESAGVDPLAKGRSDSPAPQALGLPLSPEFEAGTRALEDSLAGELANIGVAQQDIANMVELAKARLATDLADEKRQIDESSNARGIYDSGIRTSDRNKAQFRADRRLVDIGLTAAEQLRQLALQESGARGDYLRDLAELLADSARGAAQDEDAAVPTSPSEDKPPKNKPKKPRKRKRSRKKKKKGGKGGKA